MGYGSAGMRHFDPIAQSLIDQQVDERAVEAICTDLIRRLQNEGWDTEHDSLQRFEHHPVIVRAFAACGVVAGGDEL